jgi:hypothetical protein
LIFILLQVISNIHSGSFISNNFSTRFHPALYSTNTKWYHTCPFLMRY